MLTILTILVFCIFILGMLCLLTLGSIAESLKPRPLAQPLNKDYFGQDIADGAIGGGR